MAQLALEETRPTTAVRLAFARILPPMLCLVSCLGVRNNSRCKPIIGGQDYTAYSTITTILKKHVLP